MELTRGPMAFGVFLVILVLVAVSSAQITFSRQWVRGKYPGDAENGGESPEFQRTAKAVFPLRDAKRTYPRSYLKSDYVPVLISSHVLEEIYDKIRDPLIPSSALSLENAKK